MKVYGISISRWLRPVIVLAGLLFATSILAQVKSYAEQAPPLEWRDTGVVVIPTRYARLCFDATQPNVILATDDTGSAEAYNWVTGEQSRVTSLPYRFCGGSGLRFAGEGLEYERTTGFFCPADPAPCNQQTNGEGVSRASPAVSEVDPRIIYRAIVDDCSHEQYETTYSIYFSSDAGNNWEQRYRGKAECIGSAGGPLPPFVKLETIPNAPANVLLLKVNDTSSHSSRHTRFYASGDGARSFSLIGTRGLGTNVQVVHTHEGLLRLNYPPCAPYPPCTPPSTSPTLSLSTDSGRSWQQLPGPPFPPPPGGVSRDAALATVRDAPSNVFLNQGLGQLFYSSDGGHTWQQFEDYTGLFAMHITPYLPLTVIELRDNRVYALDLPDAGKNLATRTVPKGALDGTYFTQTGHNLYGAFKEYWAANGALPQQGYPLTEMFKEVNDTDGRLYTTQYFERAVFELHPENQPPNNVLLSLLGVHEYRRKYPNGTPGQVPNTSPGSVLFQETGKRLGGKFLEYWQTHGGLRQQGYPISDEFIERSDLDGKTYTVQYFERAVFELHPENQPPYDVLLSQLGTLRLKARYGIEKSAP